VPINFDGYLSPFSWRYGSGEMRALWSERNKRLLWRKLWLALARVQAGYGLVSAAQLADLAAHVTEVDIPRALAIEAEIQHDLMAELKTYAEQAPAGGGALHLGATSTDIEDNADALRLRGALDLILVGLQDLLLVMAAKIEETADLPVMAFTHLQPAEPTTLGYRLASYAQDLLADYAALKTACENVRGKGFKGAVGTAAASGDLLGWRTCPNSNAACPPNWTCLSSRWQPRPTRAGRTIRSYPRWPGWALPYINWPSTCACCSRRRSAS